MKFGMYPSEKNPFPGDLETGCTALRGGGRDPECRPSAHVRPNDPAGTGIPTIQARFGFVHPHRIPARCRRDGGGCKSAGEGAAPDKYFH